MTSKDQIIADQQKALQASEKALAEARARISRAHRSLTNGKPDEALSTLSTHLENIGMA